MIDIIIFAILSYILVTQDNIRFADDETGLYMILSWKTNSLDKEGYRVDTHYKLKRIWKYQ